MNRLLLLRRVYSTFLLSMFCVLAFAQGKQITGVIKDGTGEPMIGVNVLVKGTTNGTITDFDGKFAISDVKNSDVLTITYVGYVQQSIPVGNQTSFNIILKEDTETLDEVVVIGYGTVKKRDLTGSVASVSNETLLLILYQMYLRLYKGNWPVYQLFHKTVVQVQKFLSAFVVEVLLHRVMTRCLL